MNKVILFLWFGDEKPPYIHWTLENFRKMNPGWEIRYIEYTTSQILDYKNSNDEALFNVMSKNKTFGYIGNVSNKYRYEYLNLKKDEFIIYCDLDCFPIAPFDNFIIKPDDSNIQEWYKEQHPQEHLKHAKPLGLWTCNWGFHTDVWCLTNNNALHTDLFLQICKYSIPDENYTIWGSMLMNKNDIPRYKERNRNFHNMNIKLGDNFCLPQFTPIEHYYSLERNKLNKGVIE